MKQEKRWVAWFYENDPQHPNSVHHRKKVPYNLNVHCKITAKTNQPLTWGTYQQANATQKYADHWPEYAKKRQYGGAGFMISDGWAFLDLDNIPEKIANYSLGEHNEISDLLELLDYTYCEVSQSQSGLHFIFKVDSSVQSFTKHPDKGPELYDSGRMVALTGNLLEPDNPLKITTIDQETWEKLNIVVYSSYTPPVQAHNGAFSKLELSHGVLSEQGASIIAAIQQSSDADEFNWWMTADLPTISTRKSGKKFPNWNGELKDYDPSDQDYHYCEMLAYWVHYWTGSYDSKLIDEIFKQTNLYREKWNRKDGSGTYGQRTISRAIAKKKADLEKYIADKKAEREKWIKEHKGMVINGEK